MIVVETAGEDLEQVDILDLVKDDWQKIGIKAVHQVHAARSVFRRRVIAGETHVAVWFRPRQCNADAELEPVRTRPDRQERTAMAAMGPVLRNQGHRRPEPPDHGTGRPVGRTVRRTGTRCRIRSGAGRSGRRCSTFMPSTSSPLVLLLLSRRSWLPMPSSRTFRRRHSTIGNRDPTSACISLIRSGLTGKRLVKSRRFRRQVRCSIISSIG